MTIELFKIKNKYKLPNKYKGKKTKNGGLTINDPRKWTKKEIEWLLMLQEKNLTLKQIAQCLDRDVVSVSIKSKRLKKENGKTYNEKHRYSKYLSNEDFIKIVKPKSVLDLYSGKESYYNDKVDLVVANDINKKYKLDTNLDSLKCLCKHYYKNNKFDLVDLDPFGSAYDCFDLAIKIAKKGVIITFGELGHKRWKRIDFVSERYNIKNLEEFKTKKLVDKVIKIGIRNKKELLPAIIKKWKNISRVYFIINNKRKTDE